jgi:uncharacterized protein (TIGR03067 family)
MWTILLSIPLAIVMVCSTGCQRKHVPTVDQAGSVRLPPEGDYLITAMEVDGVQQPAKSFTPASETSRTVTLVGDKLRNTFGQPDDVLRLQWDTTKNPGHVTIQAKGPTGQIETNYGIFNYEDDTLTLCFGQGNAGEQSRPREFKTDPGSRATLMMLKKR